MRRNFVAAFIDARRGGSDYVYAGQPGSSPAKSGRQDNIKQWDGLYHEIHNEPEQAQVFAFMLDWLG